MFESCDCLSKRFDLNLVALSQSELEMHLISLINRTTLLELLKMHIFFPLLYQNSRFLAFPARRRLLELHLIRKNIPSLIKIIQRVLFALHLRQYICVHAVV